MSNKIRIEMAKLCGFKNPRTGHISTNRTIVGTITGAWSGKPVDVEVPDYPNDLNAALSAARQLIKLGVMSKDDLGRFGAWLCDAQPKIHFQEAYGDLVDCEGIAWLIADLNAKIICECILKALKNPHTDPRIAWNGTTNTLP